MATDPVCGMVVDPKHAVATSKYEGLTYYFCSWECKRIFDRAPKEVIAASRAHKPEGS